ncbi:serine hydrolase domain-containing protein [Kutzneria buriramensis]|uniref:CubicO group peptidase (Beta-lactamase class C family) n=1 Tax=Kutzneria buriramensis TaxID=1045776 RepID=A0A3E0I504_9PSEU|nr:serine hydrolase domain-containing protein [Kutzneria buriramensis]REH53838.1 CubicO group peptidase (beta-lactamase class C family) [Kutzneria buriramensis]
MTTPQGAVAPGYEAVRDEFAAIAAAEGADYSAQLVAHVHGERVVDLWTGPDVTADSLFALYSATKGAAHLVVALLVQDGVLDLDRKVADYWPEFAAEGKGELTLRDLIAHRAGLVGADDGFRVEELADDRIIAQRLAGQRPYWRPGTAFGYHALVIGALTGEVVRRVTGRSIQEIHEERVRGPLGIDFYLGLPAELEPRWLATQPMRPTPEQAAQLAANATGPNSLTGIAFNRNHPEATDLQELPNHRVVRELSPTSVGGVGSARGLAAFYAATIDGRLLKPDTVGAVGQIHSAGIDLVTRQEAAFGLGFSAVNRAYPVLGQGSFGHGGATGTEAFADPRNGIAYGYVRRRFGFPGGPGPENQGLVRALHAAATSA